MFAYSWSSICLLHHVHSHIHHYYSNEWGSVKKCLTTFACNFRSWTQVIKSYLGTKSNMSCRVNKNTVSLWRPVLVFAVASVPLSHWLRCPGMPSLLALMCQGLSKTMCEGSGDPEVPVMLAYSKNNILQELSKSSFFILLRQTVIV